MLPTIQQLGEAPGTPNRWAVPRNEHRDLHKGTGYERGGGHYNDAWRRAVAELDDVTVERLVELREQITKQFDIWQYRPGTYDAGKYLG